MPRKPRTYDRPVDPVAQELGRRRIAKIEQRKREEQARREVEKKNEESPSTP